ncbi:GNAT family N-acetyltransferase [Anaerocolumna aminovalerica]|jgi:GNAT superfamily N-acetyltransferase|uniref:GNAT family N-acetyltransferase n=1 Tax=Anaerocolumna aminovalerica TaxID=1527 RepID=UPI001C0EB8A8|nr:GNAT family N-acetyltransferase [Anaerocolumna aminovalerica]MBU5331475.1 GNAT family N-acetyltransferase [Anaerocolumna aminovalerica]
MEKYRIESFKQKYMEQLITGWNETLIFDPISEERFLQQVLMDENFNPDFALVLLVEDKVAGFCLGIKRRYPYLTRGLEENRGWISIMFVRTEYQGRGYGKALLNEVEKRLKKEQVKEITLCAYSPNYFTPGVDLKYEKALAFFEQNGYLKGMDAVSMQKDLFSYSIPQKTQDMIEQLKEEGISFNTYSQLYMEKLLAFVEREFDAGWVRNILQAIRNGEAEDTILIATDKEDQVIGYCMRKIDGNDARFGPIGVKKSVRSKGIGGILFDLQMREMQKRGIYYAYFLWTHGAAMRFYERHGMSVYRTYQLYRKNI